MAIKNTPCRPSAASLPRKRIPRIAVPVLLGPTAVGKSALALRLAQEMNWDILSCDSRQIYRGMDVGTAKPTPHEQKLVRHWIIDILDPSEEYSAGKFALDAAERIRLQSNAGKTVLLCGGTGLYFRALSEGFTNRDPSDPSIRDELMNRASEEGAGSLYDELSVVDPGSAQRIHPHDVQRIVRALAVFRTTGMRFSLLIEKQDPPEDLRFIVVKMMSPRALLYEAIDRRVEAMIAGGLWEEFLSLRQKYGSRSPGMQCVGYKELFEVDNGSVTFRNAIERIKMNTRRYAKRQFTWFNHQAHGHTIDNSTDYGSIRDHYLKGTGS